jgi:tetratricopeptide (TPR) repeat protein
VLVASLPVGVQVENAELLARRADCLLRSGKSDQALADYDRAVGLARQAADESAAFELAYKAALIEQDRKRNREAASRFRSLATASAQHPQSAEAHLLAAWNAKAADDYEAILREHVATWPRADTTAQARLWLAHWAESHGRWQDALDNYAAIPGSSTHFAAANSRLAQLAKDQPDSGPVQEAYAASLLQSDDGKMLPAALAQWQLVARRSEPLQPRWLKAQYSVALAHYKLGDEAAAVKVLRAVLDNPPGALAEEWKKEYQALLKQSGG